MAPRRPRPLARLLLERHRDRLARVRPAVLGRLRAPLDGAPPPAPREGRPRRRRRARAERDAAVPDGRTGTSARPTTSTASCSTATPTSRPLLLPDGWEGYPLLQDRGARRREHAVPRGVHPAGRHAHGHLRLRDGRRSHLADHAARASCLRACGRRAHGRDPAGDDDHQHGAAAPLDPRGAAPAPGARRRDGHQVHADHRLPAHRHREEHRVPNVDAGRHVRDAGRLPLAVLQRAGVLPGGRAAARHRGAAARAGDPGA